MKTSIEVSEKTVKAVLLTGLVMFALFALIVFIYGDLGSIYSAF